MFAKKIRDSFQFIMSSLLTKYLGNSQVWWMIVHGLSIDSNWNNTCCFLKAQFYTDEVFSFQVIQRYYVQYLSGYDAVALNQCIQNLHNLTDDESILLSSIWQSISHLTVEQVEDPEHTFDFRYPTFLIRLLISMLSVYTKR